MEEPNSPLLPASKGPRPGDLGNNGDRNARVVRLLGDRGTRSAMELLAFMVQNPDLNAAFELR